MYIYIWKCYFLVFCFVYILSSAYQNIFDPLPVLIREASWPPLIDLIIAEQ